MISSEESWKYAEESLDKVSRTFALNIRVLGKKLRRPILLAYLYMRMADTVEDDLVLTAQQKQNLLSLFSKAVINGGSHIDTFRENLPSDWQNSNKDDCLLCCNANIVCPLISEFSPKIVTSVKNAVAEMCKGMSEFVMRREQRKNDWFTIESEQDLDRYCYFVAGLVGVMLTDLFYAESFFISKKRYEEMQKLAISFGIALQIVNILKDIPEDAQKKVCFVPLSLCRENGIENIPEFFENAHLPAKQKVIERLIKKAEKHLNDAKNYIKKIPFMERHIRLFCLYPSLMAAENLAVLKSGGSKISRTAVKRIIARTNFFGWNNIWINKEFRSYCQG